MSQSRSSSYGYENVPVESGHGVLKRLAGRDVDHIYAAVSGGNDSITALHLAVQSPHITLDGCLQIDTGFGIPATHDYVERICDEWGIDYVCIGDQQARFEHERYINLVSLFGIPGSNPIAHEQIRRNLKDKPFDRFRSHLDGDLALISGVRRLESTRRYNLLDRTGIQEEKGIVWASPLVDFSDKDIRVYQDHHDIGESKVASVLCSSGECMCGCYADRKDLPLIEQFYPEFAERIYRAEWAAMDGMCRGEFPKEYALWAHGSVSSATYEAKTSAEQATLMCTDCSDQCPNQPYSMSGNALSPAEQWLQQHDPDDYYQWPFYCAVCDQLVEDPYTHRLEVHPFDAEDGLAGEWDLRMVDVSASHECGRVITEPNGWQITSSHLTTDRDEAERSKHKYYYEDTALFHCDDHDHDWEPYNGGPTRQCTECFAFDLSDFDPADPGPPVADPVDGDSTDPPSDETVDTLNRKLSEFATP